MPETKSASEPGSIDREFPDPATRAPDKVLGHLNATLDVPCPAPCPISAEGRRQKEGRAHHDSNGAGYDRDRRARLWEGTPGGAARTSPPPGPLSACRALPRIFPSCAPPLGQGTRSL